MGENARTGLGVATTPGERVWDTVSSADAVADRIADSEPPGASLPPGAPMGAYLVERQLGVGGGGAVYLARQTGSGRLVAVKVLRASLAHMPGMTERFTREVAMAKNNAHPHIVEILDSGDCQGALYYAMEYLEGLDLHELVEREGRLSPAHIVRLLVPVLDALQAVHGAGIVHRDIKPSNIMVCEVGGEQVVKLLDFGIAKVMSWDGEGQGLTAPGQALGTAQYMAPEQIRGQPVDARTDIYAVGGLIFHLATGEVPFGSSERSLTFSGHLYSPPPRVSSLAATASCLDPIVLHCLAKNPADRYQSVAELREQLVACVPAGERGRGGQELEVVLDIQVEAASREEAEGDVCELLDQVEQALGDLGLTLRSSNVSGLRASRVLGASADIEEEERTLQMHLAGLSATLEARSGAHPDVRFALRCAPVKP